MQPTVAELHQDPASNALLPSSEDLLASYVQDCDLSWPETFISRQRKWLGEDVGSDPASLTASMESTFRRFLIELEISSEDLLGWSSSKPGSDTTDSTTAPKLLPLGVLAAVTCFRVEDEFDWVLGFLDAYMDDTTTLDDVAVFDKELLHTIADHLIRLLTETLLCSALVKDLSSQSGRHPYIAARYDTPARMAAVTSALREKLSEYKEVTKDLSKKLLTIHWETGGNVLNPNKTRRDILLEVLARLEGQCVE
ncbi:uncharacterized protein AB675_8521 [Cyphellophora attinorum]|uniref:Uncharacterized protein n=1 Tax=Cyphellophora attinorum TaxID=1664694 RepID=A0A0N0NR62_9EURO|nr:uncharacterized protein AB675_8521 [Phialophora attinorum]KPI44718.1 hypothetical protein AB675_8521 [Phialophora attinorum]